MVRMHLSVRAGSCSLLFALLVLGAVPGLAQLPSFRSDSDLARYLRDLSTAHDRRIAAAANCAGTVHLARVAGLGLDGAVVHGRVTDLEGSSVSGATVEALGLSVTSDSEGAFQLRLPTHWLPSSGDVSLSVRAIGYRKLQRGLRVKASDSIEVALALCTSETMMEAVVVSGAALAQSITNTQDADVDEGDIVKLHGDHLVILRRGRLFTVALGTTDLRAVAAVDAFGPGIDPRQTWYDELLVSGDKVVVVGYSYARGGTEIGVFHIDSAGRLEHAGTYQLRSNDYYSARNYASRLIGTTLVFYSPLYLPFDLKDPLSALPAMRRWDPHADGGGRFVRIATPQRVYRAASALHLDEIALHTITRCDLAAADFACEATVVIGPAERVFYVSPQAVYVWMSGWSPIGRRRAPGALLCRLPMDGSAPRAIGVSGTPVDQFSFLESDDGHLNVLVRTEAYGDWMWGSEFASGEAALVRMPLSSFGDGAGHVPASLYRPLPVETGDAFHNRFVGDFLLYGVGAGWGRPADDGSTLYVVPWRRQDGPITRLVLRHGTDRIESMGADAVIIGADSRDLHFTGIRLGATPTVMDTFALPHASQGELRSHGFFYRPDGAHTGVLGLPVAGADRAGSEHLFYGSASVLFLQNRDGEFLLLGRLEARASGSRNDACKASCVDWYGNARPIFMGERVLALLGYELVEGAVSDGRVVERGRVDFSPMSARTVGR